MCSPSNLHEILDALTTEENAFNSRVSGFSPTFLRSIAILDVLVEQPDLVRELEDSVLCKALPVFIV